MHAELAAYELKEQGYPCGRKHREWFDIDWAHARRVVLKWSNRMRTNPYRETQLDRWELSHEHLIGLASLSCPSQQDVDLIAGERQESETSRSSEGKRCSSHSGFARHASEP